MHLRRLPRLAYLIPVLTALAGLVLQVLDPVPLATLRNSLFDQYQRWHPRQYRALPVRIVDIDEGSLSRYGQWPWPRTLVAELVEKIRGGGARAIGFDFIFAEPDRSSPRNAMATWALPADLADRLQSLPDHDRILADSLRTGGVVIGSALERGGGSADSPRQTARFVAVGGDGMARVVKYQQIARPIPELEDAADGIGALNFVPDSDGVVRRVPLVLALNAMPVPSLGAEMLRVAQRTPNIQLRRADDGSGLDSVRIGNLDIPVTASGEVWVHFTARAPERRVPAWKVLRGDLPAGALKDQLVLVGTSAQGLLDLRFSPMGEIVPGIEIHAQALEQILGGEHLSRPYWALAVEAIALAVGALMVGAIALSAAATLSATATAILLGVMAVVAWNAFIQHGLLLDPLTPAIGVLISFVLASIARHRDAERRQRWIRDAFTRYVSPNLVDHLISHPDRLELGGERRECSFVFTDVADFTRLMESTDPARAVSLLNRYLDGMIAIAFRHEGTLDRVVGDAIAIMFSAPLDQPDHRARALDCALEMRDFANHHRGELAPTGIEFGVTRIGVHGGEVIVGNLGGSAMFDYRALGDPVNVAARLESANKQLGTQVCVSSSILDGAPDARTRPIGRLQLEGRSVPVMAYEPLPDEDGSRHAAYMSAYQCLEDSPREAEAAFSALCAAYPGDPLAAYHLARLRRGETGDLIVLAGK